MPSFARNWLLTGFVGGLLVVFSQQTRADVITISLANPNPAISGFAAPYGTVTVNRTSSTTADITLTSNTVGGFTYLFGDGGTIGLNVNATNFSWTNISGSNSSGTGFSPWSLVSVKSGQEDGFGTFNFQVNSFDGFDHAIDKLTLTLTDTSGMWSSASNVLTPNSGGSTVAAHVYITASPANQTNGAIVTGYAGNGTNSSVVPEPSSLALGLFGVVALSLTQIRRWIRRKALALA